MRVHAIKRFLKNNCYKSYSENGSEVSKCIVYTRYIHNVITEDGDCEDVGGPTVYRFNPRARPFKRFILCILVRYLGSPRTVLVENDLLGHIFFYGKKKKKKANIIVVRT